ncbi:MAG: glutamate--tRNA ligase [Promethearchaeota archaeon]|nr:MAG: glutamate--tRNA ligase [Candidatus Lokiarchaeota archaeon]
MRYMADSEIKKILWISGLKNAVEFGGKPNKKAVMGKLMAEREDLRSQAKTLLPILDQIIEEISQLSIDEQKLKLLELDPTALEKKEVKEEIKELPDLPNADKYDKVIMRLAPYPSGALHIGNARMIILNDEYVRRYNGELILFYDDTIGSPKSLRDSPKAKYVLPESYDLIKEGLDWLGVKFSKIFYKSDRLEIFYEYCEKLIRDNMAYICFCQAEEFKNKYKNQKKNCPHRNQSIEKNLEEWEKMLNDEYRETEAVVRLKTGMDQKDPALRDQIIMRISEAEHPRVGNKYTVWPMLEYSWAIDDHLIGVTHILRGADLIKEDFIEDFIWDHFKWEKAEFLHYGRLNFPDMKLSKTEARNNIQNGNYEGWDDPRTWSLQSLKKRGIKPEALKQALLDLGMSLSGISFSVNWLYAKNKDIIDEISDRYFFVEDPILVEIDEVPFMEYIAEPMLLPSNPDKGNRIIKGVVKNKIMKIFIASSDAKEIKANQIVRLKDLINIQINNKDLKKRKVNAKYDSLELNRDFPILHWIPEDKYIKVSILKPDGTVSKGYGEINLLKIPMNKTIQFERYGFVNPIKLEKKELFCYFTH